MSAKSNRLMKELRAIADHKGFEIVDLDTSGRKHFKVRVRQGQKTLRASCACSPGDRKSLVAWGTQVKRRLTGATK